jgi:hypothetical protein
VRADQILGCASLAATSRARRPLVLLAAIVLVAGSFSAFLVNDTICLVMTPLVLDLVTQIDRDPIPYLLAVAMRSNVGSTATITGNPQNMITALASWGARIRTWEWRKSKSPRRAIVGKLARGTGLAGVCPLQIRYFICILQRNTRPGFRIGLAGRRSLNP